jgi:hypothetical protein
VHTLSVEAGVKFDLTGEGQKTNIGWVDANDGLLVRDINRDGQINDGRELFGQGTVLSDGTRASDGYVALGAMDSNQDGQLDASDTGWTDLAVWQDANSDGVTQDGELSTLDQLGVTAIDLSAQRTSILDQGNWIGLESNYTTTDGKQHALADVWFQINPTTPNTLDLSQLDPAQVAKGALAQIDLANDGKAETLNISAADVQVFGQKDLIVNDQTGEGNVQMIVKGDAADVVHLTGPEGQWQNQGMTQVDGEVYHILQQDNLQLLIGVNMYHDPTLM